MSIKKVFLASAALAFVASSGCSSSGGNDNPYFAGVWRMILTTLENTCDGETYSTEVELTVNQDGEMIAVTSSFGNTFSGSTTGSNSMSASSSYTDNCFDEQGNVDVNSSYDGVATYTFTNLNGDTATVEFREDLGNCTGNEVGFDASCYLRETAQAQRIS